MLPLINGKGEILGQLLLPVVATEERSWGGPLAAAVTVGLGGSGRDVETHGAAVADCAVAGVVAVGAAVKAGAVVGVVEMVFTRIAFAGYRSVGLCALAGLAAERTGSLLRISAEDVSYRDVTTTADVVVVRLSTLAVFACLGCCEFCLFCGVVGVVGGDVEHVSGEYFQLMALLLHHAALVLEVLLLLGQCPSHLMLLLLCRRHTHHRQIVKHNAHISLSHTK